MPHDNSANAASPDATHDGEEGLDPDDGSRGVTPIVLEDGDAASAERPDTGSDEPAGEQVTSPTKLIRIASMVRTMLEEVRQAPLDEEGRRRLREIYERTMSELRDVLSDDLRDELDEMVLPFSADAPTESELRLAQAQLVGWLEGLFHGIQATLFQQQAAATAQFEEMRRRAALEAGGPDVGGPGAGQYL